MKTEALATIKGYKSKRQQQNLKYKQLLKNRKRILLGCDDSFSSHELHRIFGPPVKFMASSTPMKAVVQSAAVQNTLMEKKRVLPELAPVACYTFSPKKEVTREDFRRKQKIEEKRELSKKGTRTEWQSNWWRPPTKEFQCTSAPITMGSTPREKLESQILSPVEIVDKSFGKLSVPFKKSPLPSKIVPKADPFGVSPTAAKYPAENNSGGPLSPQSPKKKPTSKILKKDALERRRIKQLHEHLFSLCAPGPDPLDLLIARKFPSSKSMHSQAISK